MRSVITSALVTGSVLGQQPLQIRAWSYHSSDFRNTAFCPIVSSPVDGKFDPVHPVHARVWEHASCVVGLTQHAYPPLIRHSSGISRSRIDFRQVLCEALFAVAGTEMQCVARHFQRVFALAVHAQRANSRSDGRFCRWCHRARRLRPVWPRRPARALSSISPTTDSPCSASVAALISVSFFAGSFLSHPVRTLTASAPTRHHVRQRGKSHQQNSSRGDKHSWVGLRRPCRPPSPRRMIPVLGARRLAASREGLPAESPSIVRRRGAVGGSRRRRSDPPLHLTVIGTNIAAVLSALCAAWRRRSCPCVA